METVTNEVEQIKEILPILSDAAIHELKAFTDYLADREKRRGEMVARVLNAERNPDAVSCSSSDEFIQAIMNTDVEG